VRRPFLSKNNKKKIFANMYWFPALFGIAQSHNLSPCRKVRSRTPTYAAYRGVDSGLCRIAQNRPDKFDLNFTCSAESWINFFCKNFTLYRIAQSRDSALCGIVGSRDSVQCGIVGSRDSALCGIVGSRDCAMRHSGESRLCYAA
jgi:hypothetical protein